MNSNQSQRSSAFISGLFFVICLFTFPANGVSLDINKLAQAIASYEEARLKLLSSSKGNVSLELHLYERIPNDSTKTLAKMVHDLGPDSRKYISHSRIKWDVSWYQKGLKRRFDTHIDFATSQTICATFNHQQVGAEISDAVFGKDALEIASDAEVIDKTKKK
jgi:hypothetical protein